MKKGVGLKKEQLERECSECVILDEDFADVVKDYYLEMIRNTLGYEFCCNASNWIFNCFTV